jgi:hypothetical protein
LVCAVALLSGCAASYVALAKKDLDVQTRMSDSIFLDPVSSERMTIYVKVRNTSDKPNFDLGDAISSAMQAKGFRVMTDPDRADFMLLAQVLSVEKASPTAAEAALRDGYGGAILAGGGAGALIGRAVAGGTGAGYGAGSGALIGGLAEHISGALVKDVVYLAITDVELRERPRKGVIVREDRQQDSKQGIGGSTRQTSSEIAAHKRYRTRVVSTANKVNLHYEEAAPQLTAGLARSLAGLF